MTYSKAINLKQGDHIKLKNGENAIVLGLISVKGGLIYFNMMTLAGIKTLTNKDFD